MSTDEAFRLARLTGFDGVEVMVTADRGTRRADLLRASSARWGLPVLSVHAPVLPIAHFAFGRDQRDKLLRSAELAAELRASTVVVHPRSSGSGGTRPRSSRPSARSPGRPG